MRPSSVRNCGTRFKKPLKKRPNGTQPLAKHQCLLLKGVLQCAACHVSMTPTYTAKKNRHYRYYVCSNVLRGKACHGIGSYLAAGEVEHFVIKQVRHILQSPEIAAQTSLFLEQAGLNKSQAFERLKDIDGIWHNLFPIEQQKIIQILIRTVLVGTEGVDVRINQNGLHSLVLETQDESTA